MKPWIEPKTVYVPPELAAMVGGHPLVAETLVRRGIIEPRRALAFLDPSRYSPADACELPGIERAVARLAQALTRGERIGVWGDFDVDGQTATTLLVSALRDLGAEVEFHIPVRAQESHGVGLPALKAFLSQPIDVLITCDTGIAAHDSIAYAQSNGVDVILTDHHELPEHLPLAFSITNPRLLPAEHALATLPGVGVVYKLVEGLYQYYNRGAEAERFLDLVALGLVADVAELTRDARFLLQRGLEKLRSTPRAGLRAIMANAELDPHFLSEEHIAFSIAPRLNAIGRLADANPVVELLSTEDEGRARTLAAQIEALNDRRKLLTSQVYQGALAQIKANPAVLDEAALVLANPYWPAGVIGIVASRLVERFGKPVVLFASPAGEAARGSARSTPGIHITQAIGAAAASENGLVGGYGGHAAAAGLSIDAERITDFRRKLGRAILRLFPDRPAAALPVDGWLPFSSLSLELVADLERLAPFGAGNPSLVLAAPQVRFIRAAPVGRTGEHVQITVEDAEGLAQRVLWWQGAAELEAEPLPSEPFDLAYTVRASSFRGQRQVQVEWDAYRPIASTPAELSSRPKMVVHDRRQALYPLAELQKLRSQGKVSVWAEAEARRHLNGQHRLELGPASVLVIWTVPPGRKELEEVLMACSPSEVYLFAVDPQLDQMETFLARLSGLVKHAMKLTGKPITLGELSAAMAHRMAAVQAGLVWLEQKGVITVSSSEDGDLLLKAGENGPAAQTSVDAAAARLAALLEETAAFRSFFRRAGSEALIQFTEKPKKTGSSRR